MFKQILREMGVPHEHIEQQWGKDFVAGFYKNLSDMDRY